MNLCPHCKRNSLYESDAFQGSSLSNQPITDISKGLTCYNCGHWVEGGSTTSKPMDSKREKQTNERNRSINYRWVEERIGVIEVLRANHVPWNKLAPLMSAPMEWKVLWENYRQVKAGGVSQRDVRRRRNDNES